MWRIIFGTMLFLSSAHAQTVWTETMGLQTTSICSMNGDVWKELGMVCHSDPQFHQSQPSLAGPPGFSVVNTPSPKCSDGWSPVIDSAGHPMCAKELKNPE